MERTGQFTPSETNALLKSLGHSPQKKLGQNFLVDSNIVRKSLELADVCAGDCVVEVGPGLGTLTGALLQAGAKVYAIELDKTLFAHLKVYFAENQNLNLINADAVNKPLADLPEDCVNFKIVANLPYAISTPWLDAVLSGRLPQRMSLMLQKEAALRFSAKKSSGDYSPISIFLAGAYDALSPHKVSAACFHPRPAVDSMLLPLIRKKTPYIFTPLAKRLIRAVFSKRRKQIGSIVKSAGADSAYLADWLNNCPNLNPQARPEDVSFDDWKTLNEVVQK